MNKPEHGYAAYQVDFISNLSWRVRKQIFQTMMDEFKPTAKMSFLDIGVMGNADPGEFEANYLEKLYPFPEKIHGVTLENPAQLKQQFPKSTFTQASGLALPFPDQSFDIAFSAAVLEHVGSRANQLQFVREACRVGKNVFIATPDRYFPVEAHSRLPLINYLPLPAFRAILKVVGLENLSREEVLNPLSKGELRALFDGIGTPEMKSIRLFGFSQNIIAILKRK